MPRTAYEKFTFLVTVTAEAGSSPAAVKRAVRSAVGAGLSVSCDDHGAYDVTKPVRVTKPKED
jgi:hypothetical protein